MDPLTIALAGMVLGILLGMAVGILIGRKGSGHRARWTVRRFENIDRQSPDGPIAALKRQQ